MASCKESEDALTTVCRLYGDASTACKVTTEQHSNAGCSLGESPSGNGCDENNFDSAPAQVCAAAKRLCNIKGMDYCTTAAHVDCMKSIGAICPLDAGDGSKKKPAGDAAPEREEDKETQEDNKSSTQQNDETAAAENELEKVKSSKAMAATGEDEPNASKPPSEEDKPKQVKIPNMNLTVTKPAPPPSTAEPVNGTSENATVASIEF